MTVKKMTEVKQSRRIAAGLGTAAVAAAYSLFGAAAPQAAADCPDVEVVFARGSGEAPGLGNVGGPFVDSLRSQIGGRSLTVFPVNSAASTDFSGADFAKSVIDGIRDAGSHIESMTANCPKTREVLGGYSQGAALIGYVTTATVPAGVPAASVPKPIPAEVANHVAAGDLFGTPAEQFLHQYGAPSITIGPAYQPKTLELCAEGDPICGDGNNQAAHVLCSVNRMKNQAATFPA